MLTRLVFLSLIFPLPAAAAEPQCDAAVPGVVCSCDVRTLRPLQGAIGIEEVQEKVKKIKADPEAEYHDLANDPIKVIRGPKDKLFITDHHHGADAWRLAGHPIALCEIGDRPPFATEAEFWSGLVNDHLIRLRDAGGKALTPEQLPHNLEGMPNDPYRSLAWRVRKAHGFCRPKEQKEFMEFAWADQLRAQPKLPADKVGKSAKSMLSEALLFAQSQAAQGLPGYIGAKPAGFKCPKGS
jgi:hypothetical protein